jgi:Vam6/Vps39-like protein vacuolar protein sorting-associated protein 39
LINDLGDLSPSFHDSLVALYLDEASSLQGDKKDEIRGKLASFLEKSDQYMPERVLARLSKSIFTFLNFSNLGDVFLPERAIVLSKMGQHKAALEIYVFKLQDYTKAEKYFSFF